VKALLRILFSYLIATSLLCACSGMTHKDHISITELKGVEKIQLNYLFSHYEHTSGKVTLIKNKLAGSKNDIELSVDELEKLNVFLVSIGSDNTENRCSVYVEFKLKLFNKKEQNTFVEYKGNNCAWNENNQFIYLLLSYASGDLETPCWRENTC